MISYAEALQIVHDNARPLPGQVLRLADACGGVTSVPVVARLPVPGFANAAMDGFVVCAGATGTASPESPVRLPVAGLIAAGDRSPVEPGGAAWEILTGAPVPPGLDAVVPLERVTRVAASVLITEPLAPGHNVRQCGEDFLEGQVIVAAGTRLAPHHLMGLAAGGVDEVALARPPRVAVLTTGNELAAHGAMLAPGQIRDANGPYLQALVPLLGARLKAVATATDAADDLRRQLGTLAGEADMVLTTGGVSAGRLDLLPAVIRELGGELLFHKVAIRPGKPLLHARLPDGTLVFGLPGNPLAVAVGMRFFVIPALRVLQGLRPEREAPAVSAAALRGRGILRFFAKARVETDAAGCRRVQVLPGQESFRIAPLVRANCWAIVPEGVAGVPAGGIVQTMPLYPDDSVPVPAA